MARHTLKVNPRRNLRISNKLLSSLVVAFSIILLSLDFEDIRTSAVSRCTTRVLKVFNFLSYFVISQTRNKTQIQRTVEHEEANIVNDPKEENEVPVSNKLLNLDIRVPFAYKALTSFIIGFDELVSTDDSLIQPHTISSTYSSLNLNPVWRRNSIDASDVRNSARTKYRSAVRVKHAYVKLNKLSFNITSELSLMNTHVWIGLEVLNPNQGLFCTRQCTKSSLSQILELPYVVSYKHSEHLLMYGNHTWKPKTHSYWDRWHLLGQCSRSDLNVHFHDLAGRESIPFIRVHIYVSSNIVSAFRLQVSGDVLLQGTGNCYIRYYSLPDLVNSQLSSGNAFDQNCFQDCENGAIRH